MDRNMRPKRGEIWLVDFEPTIGSEIKKIRPALVISSELRAR
jgi:mRNA interferase MazF